MADGEADTTISAFIPQDTEEENSPPSRTRSNRRRYVCTGLLLLLVVVVGIVLGVTLSGKKDTAEQPESKGQKGNVYIKTIDGLLINQNVCNADTCKKCEEQFPVDSIPSEARYCDCDCGKCSSEVKNENEDCNCGKCNPKIINATCFICNQTCWTPDDLIAHWNKSKRLDCINSAPERITCCIIARMKNLNKPSADGRFKCYNSEDHKQFNISTIQPLYHCQNGKTGDKCEKLNKVPFSCKCYTPTYNFVGQSKMMECNRIPTTPNCYTKINEHSCICSRRNETDVANTKDCSKAQLGKLTSGSQRQLSYNIYIVAFVALLTVFSERP